MDIHQPDPAQPDRFLGTCPGCGRWYRIEDRPIAGQVVVVRLPEVGEVLPSGMSPAG